MKKTCILILIISLDLSATAQEKPGFVDREKLYAALESIAGFREIQQRYRDTLELLAKQLEDYVDRGMPHNRKMAADERKKEEDSLAALQLRITNFQTYATSKLEHLSYSTVAYLESKIKTFCAEKKISMLSDTEVMPYCAGCIDYTEELIKYLEAKK
jgi:Skp family chaperone for outer membrane proteins